MQKKRVYQKLNFDTPSCLVYPAQPFAMLFSHHCIMRSA